MQGNRQSAAEVLQKALGKFSDVVRIQLSRLTNDYIVKSRTVTSLEARLGEAISVNHARTMKETAANALEAACAKHNVDYPRLILLADAVTLENQQDRDLS